MPTTTTNVEHVALEGPLALPTAVALGVALLGLFAWTLWRECRVLGPRATALFLVLRSAALGAAIWMLLSPAAVRVQTSTTRKAVAIAVDTSGSMRTVDPAGTSDELRWAVSGDAKDRYVATQTADRAVAAIGVARRQLTTATDALTQHRPESDVVDAALGAGEAIRRSRAHLRSLAESPAGLASARKLARKLIEQLQAPEIQAFDRLCGALRKGRSPSEKGWRESLPDLAHRLASVESALSEFARQVASEEASRVARENPGLLTSAREASRVGRAAAALRELKRVALDAVGRQADVRWIAFDEEANPLADGQALLGALNSLPASPEELSALKAGATDLAAVLDHLHRGRREQPLAAALLLTDAAHNRPGAGDPRQAAAALQGAPVYVVPIGGTRRLRDVILQSVSAPSVALRNDEIVVEARLEAHDCAGEVCVVQLLEDGEVVDFREVAIDSQFASRTVRFQRDMPSIGEWPFQMAVVPLPGELTEENNYGQFEVAVTRSDINVLLADETPRWEYRYLAQLFRRDAKVQCDELLYRPRTIATGRREETKTVPVTVDDWDQYDVVLMGDLPPERFPVAAQESLVEYLKLRGGTLVLIAGQEAMPVRYVDHPLADILPVLPVENAAPASDAGYAFRVTEEGRDHVALMIDETDEATRVAWDFVNRFAPLPEVSLWRRPRPSARTLIAAVPRAGDEAEEGKSDAFLCWQPVGRGKVVYFSGPDTYRLRFLRGDRLHYRFWGQLLRWAIAADLSVGSEFVRVRTDKSRYGAGDTVHVTVRLMDAEGQPVVAEGLQAMVTSGDVERSVPLVAASEIPGEYIAQIHSPAPGVYRIEPTGPAIDALQENDAQDPAAASFTVQAELPGELADTRCDWALAGQIAGLTGGQALPPTAVEEILALTDLAPIVSEKTERRPLWLEWKYLWLIFGCLQIEWVIRKWKGLS